jgi:hypothetical protein
MAEANLNPAPTASRKKPAVAAAALDEPPIPAPREPMIYTACKMPLSMSQEVKRIARDRHVSDSEVIRYFVAQGLRSPFASRKSEAV